MVKGKKKIFLFSFLLFCVFSMIFTMKWVHQYLPEEIHIIEGREESFDFGLPFQASVINESISVLNVNQEPVEDNIEVSLSQPIKMVSSDIGKATMEISFLGIPVKTVPVSVLPDAMVIPCGNTVGISFSTEGIMVLGTGKVVDINGEDHQPSKGILRSGDLILKAQDIALEEKEDLMEVVEQEEEEVKLTIKRGDQIQDVFITPVKSRDDGLYKLGVWVRDSTQGIGTLTYYDPNTQTFGALGHGVYDVDTKELMSLKEGELYLSRVTGIHKGEKGAPGELLGEIDKENSLGAVALNTEAGVYGKVNDYGVSQLPSDPVPIAMKQDVHTGKAYVRTNAINGVFDEYEIEIESINSDKNSDDKGMTIRITDERLLEKTNGIVQGFSGSPIIQDGRLIGAVTHVFVQDPAKGYGIFIENMMKQYSGV